MSSCNDHPTMGKEGTQQENKFSSCNSSSIWGIGDKTDITEAIIDQEDKLKMFSFRKR